MNMIGMAADGQWYQHYGIMCLAKQRAEQREQLEPKPDFAAIGQFLFAGVCPEPAVGQGETNEPCSYPPGIGKIFEPSDRCGNRRIFPGFATAAAEAGNYQYRSLPKTREETTGRESCVVGVRGEDDDLPF